MSTHQQDYHNFELPCQNAGFDAELAQPPRRTRRSGSCCFFGCCLGCLGFLVLIALACFALWYCLVSGGADLIVSEETTVITEPLKSDGKTVDFFQAIQKMTEPAIPANENGFRDVLLAFGRAVFGGGGDAEWQYSAVCEALEIDPQLPPQEIPPFDDNNLNLVQAAVAKQHYFVPLVRRSEKDLAVMSQPYLTVSFHDKLLAALQESAEIRYDGNVAEAWKDTLASIRLFRFISINRMMVELPFGDYQHEMLESHVSEVVTTLPKWTPEQLKQAIKDLESLPNWQDRQTTQKMMQFMLLDLISSTNNWDVSLNFLADGESEELQAMLGMLRFIAIDWNLVAKELNSEVRVFGKLMEKAEGKSLDEQFELLRLSETTEKLDEEDLQTLLEDAILTTGDLPLFTSGRSKLAGVIAGKLVRTTAGKLCLHQFMEESRCQALRLALALELYRQEHQEYPDALDKLGLQPMPVNMNFQYEKQDAGYRLQNKVFELEI